jgi:hypothetical protein
LDNTTQTFFLVYGCDQTTAQSTSVKYTVLKMAQSADHYTERKE